MSTHIVIMAGGIGSRLYPLSTPEHPKQFLDLLDCGKSLIRLTYERFLKVDAQARFWVVTAEKYVHFIHEQVPEIPDEQILAEPVARNTAPCISYVCRKIALRYPDARIMVTPSDAYVPDADAFARTSRCALDFCGTRESIVCLGIEPAFPSCEYGYIKEIPDDVFRQDGEVIRKVDSFKEKPSSEVAGTYLAQGGYWWNAGIFVWDVAVIERQLRRHAPQIESVTDQMAPSFYTPGEQECVRALFPTFEKISIDYAIMEKSPDIYMAPGRWAWSDLGSFEAIEKVKAGR